MSTHRRAPRLAVALAALALGLAACGGKGTEASSPTPSGGGTPGVEASGACAMLVEYDGHDYLGAAVDVTPVAGESIGTATIPPCNDTGGAGTTIPAEQVEVTAVQGMPPSIAIMLAGRDDVVLVRDDVQKLPKELAPR